MTGIQKTWIVLLAVGAFFSGYWVNEFINRHFMQAEVRYHVEHALRYAVESGIFEINDDVAQEVSGDGEEEENRNLRLETGNREERPND